jgi:hypothetical protein
LESTVLLVGGKLDDFAVEVGVVLRFELVQVVNLRRSMR